MEFTLKLSDYQIHDLIAKQSEVSNICINALSTIFHHEQNREKHSTDAKGCYYFIPMSVDRVLEELLCVKGQLKKPSYNYRLLDVGCGIGNIMLLANHTGFQCSGIEHNSKLVKRAFYPEAYKYGDRPNIMHGDALDFQDYDKFDIIYYYCPIANHKKEYALEKLIEDNMKVDAWLIANGKMRREIYEDKRFKPMHKAMPIWQKVSA